MRSLLNLWPMFHSAKTDNLVFKLYYCYTVLILLLFSFVISCRLILKNSFICSSNYNDAEIISAYCYTHDPYIVLSVLSKNTTKQTVYPGITHEVTPSDKRLYFPYYPWVNLFFLVLAILFYLPHLIWKKFEGGLVTRLTSKVNNSTVSETERKAAIIEIAKYLITTCRGHLIYTFAYVLSEVLNWLVGVLLTVWLVSFFNVEINFSSTEFEMKTWDDFFTYNFPLMAQCDYRRYGASGDVQRHNSLCHLPLNNLYGYMFLFLYGWFILLCVLQALVIPLRVLELILPPIRVLVFTLRSGIKDQALLNTISSRFSLGDWFLLTRLQKNLLTHDLIMLLTYVQNNLGKNLLDLDMGEFNKEI